MKELAILLTLVFFSLNIFSQELSKEEKRSIVKEAVFYYKQPKSNLTIAEARKHLLKAKKVLPKKDPTLYKLEVAFGRMNLDKNLLKKESINHSNFLSISSNQMYWILFGLLILAIGLTYLSYRLWRLYRNRNNRLKKYSGLINVDEEIIIRNGEVDDLNSQISILKEKYKAGTREYEKLKKQNALYQENLEIADFGIYEPYFEYGTSEKFKIEVKLCREDQKALVRSKRHVMGGDNWTVNGSLTEGKRMINRQKKIMLRAFNGECDSFIKSVSWSNIIRMEERMIKSFGAINKTGVTQNLRISDKYLKLKLKELRLTHEYNLKRYEEKEEQRRIREQMREEQKVLLEAKKAKQESEKEEKILKEAMRKAEEKYKNANEIDQLRYKADIMKLEKQLKDALEKGKRAISLAQQTKVGAVYVVSNFGSFGENVFKIGMTRRFEPMDRVKELGDASVPFNFDVHAIIKTDNAPELESKLHKTFEKDRINLVNRRREFFNVDMDEIAKVVTQYQGEINFTKSYEAKEYRESLMLKGEKGIPIPYTPEFQPVELSEVFS